MPKKKERRLTEYDFLVISYGQTRKEALADYKHYVETGEIR